MIMKSKIVNITLFNLFKINNHRIRKYIINFLIKFEGGAFYSKTLRKIFKHYFDIKIGLYTYGSCFEIGNFDRHTSVGRYCSIATGVRVINRNHPMEFKSMHAFFYNPNLKHCNKSIIEYIPLSIGNDVWIGFNVLIMPNVKNIGDGSVIGAGSVVTKDIPPYAVVVGTPAKVIRYRFTKNTILKLLASKWWEKSIDELKPYIDEFQIPYKTNDNH